MNLRLFSAWALLASTSDRVVVVDGKSRPSGGFRPSGSRPSGSSYSAPRPSPPSYYSPSASRPSYPPPSASRPSTPTLSRPAPKPYKSPTGPVPYNSRSPYNPNPSYKSFSPAGAPTIRSGGGGFSSKAKSVAVTVAKAAALGLAVGAVINIARGAFLYGGRHSSPYCRGDDLDRYASGRCPVGRSTTSHRCAGQIPMCPVPQSVRDDWAVGPDAPPKVEVSFDGSVCSVVPAPPAAPATSGGNGTAATSSPAPTATAPGGNDTATTAAVEGVDGASGLDSCVSRILSSGGCDAHGAGGLFQYDDSAGTCGCCSTPQVVPLGNFSSAVYSFRTEGVVAGDASGPPELCVSGATVHYPSVSLGSDATFRCDCGACSDCGRSGPRYLDWSGPFAVSDARGEAAIAGTAAAPLYDPVDACVCGETEGTACEEVQGSVYGGYSSAASVGGGAALQVATGAVLVWLVGRR